MLGPTDYRLSELAEEARVRPSHLFHFIHWLAAGNPPEAFAAFAKLEQKHTDAMLAALRDHDLEPSRPAAAKRRRGTSVDGKSQPCMNQIRGTRLPAVFQAPQEWIDYAQTKRKWALAEVHEELDRFTDYWHARAGAGGVKADWLATWRNWCRNSTRPDGSWSGMDKLNPEQFAIKCEEIALGWEKMHRYDEAAKWRAKIRA